jgi:hypothetical protein
MALPTWLSVAFTIADFVVQRVDRVGPVSFEPPEKQPPETATETVDAPEMDASLDEAPAADVDTPEGTSSGSIGFRAGGGGGPSPSGGNGGGGSGGNGGDNGDDPSARGGGGKPSGGDTPTGGNSDDDDDDNGNGSAQLARAGGGNDPTPAPPPDPDGDDDDDDNGEEQEHHDDRSVQCSFRSMRPSDTPTRYEVEKARDNAGEERPA